MSEQVHQGWLTTRDGKKYAPATLIQNVFSGDGTPYDTKIKSYVNSKDSILQVTLTNFQQSTNQNITNLNQKDIELDKKISNINQEIADINANINIDDSNTLYIIDNNENVIAYIDKDGMHSINFIVKDANSDYLSLLEQANITQTLSNNNRNDLNQLSETVKERLKNFNGEDTDSLFFIDDNDNVIAYIDKDGIHTTELYIQTGLNVDTTLHIYDNEQKLLASIDNNGIHTTNLYITGESDGIREKLNTFNVRTSNIENEIADLKDKDKLVDNEISNIWTKISNFNDDSSDTLYIIDKDTNVIAYIDEKGIHSVDFLIEDQEGNSTKLTEKIKNLTDEDTIIHTSILNAKNDLTNAIDVVREDLNNLIIKTENDLSDIINNRLKNFNGDDNNALYIIDNNENVIAYINQDGLTLTDLHLKTSSGYTKKDDMIFMVKTNEYTINL